MWLCHFKVGFSYLFLLLYDYVKIRTFVSVVVVVDDDDALLEDSAVEIKLILIVKRQHENM